MNVHVDDVIFHLQAAGGISRVWRSLMPELRALPGLTFDPDAAPDLFISTYYAPAPRGVKSLAVVYDCIAERFATIGAQHPDAVAKRAAVRAAGGVVAISQFSADDCLRFCGRDAAVAYCGGGEVFQRVTPHAVTVFQQRYGILKPYVLLVGRRDLYKNAQALYQAWPLWSAHQQHMVVVVGGEAPTPADRAFGERYPGAWMQIKPDDADLAAAYSGATALAYPSIWEGFGLPILEALACGCPVVMGHNGAGEEVARGAAFYGDPLLPRSYAAALDACLEPSARLHQAIDGLARAKQFTWRKMAESMARAIRSVA